MENWKQELKLVLLLTDFMHLVLSAMEVSAQTFEAQSKSVQSCTASLSRCQWISEST